MLNSAALIQACFTNNFVLFQIGNWLDIAYRIIVPFVLLALNYLAGIKHIVFEKLNLPAIGL